MNGGFLRRSIGVTTGQDVVSLAHPFWSLELPRNWVDSIPRLWNVLRAEEPKDVLDRSVPGVNGLLELLEANGCFSVDGNRSEYSLLEVRDLFKAIATQWYGEYYRHPLWSALRDGTLSQRGFVAWLIHNYHVSRSAGMSDARCAVRLKRSDLRRIFARNAVDEYAHCDDFFFVRHPQFAIPDEDIKEYVHLAPSLAFDQMMLRMAEDDWLGHLLVSFFQESTARFSENTRTFYRVVEKRYGLEGLFALWEKHLDIDLACEHAGRLEDLFSATETCTRSELVRSFQNAWFTVRHLQASLDAILAIGASGTEPALRSPIRDGVVDPRNALVAQSAPEVMKMHRLAATNGFELNREMIAAGICPPDGSAILAPQDIAYVYGEIGRAIFTAMSYSSRHDDVVLYGRLAEHLKASLNGDATPISPEATGLACFLLEAAVCPRDLAFLLHRACFGNIAPWLPIDDRGTKHLSGYLESTTIGGETRDRWMTLGLQFDEVLRRWLRCSSAPANDFFRD